ncbi:MAG: HYR domain-containing protein [Verrucomicrobiales bacterium]|nr:HYR domain-containing protein [Verrucomicrobiales bacterium]
MRNRSDRTAFLALPLPLLTARRLLRPMAAGLALMGAPLHAQSVILHEDFDGPFPGTWAIGDNDATDGAAFWGSVDVAFGGQGSHSGGHKGYCAATGFRGEAAAPRYRDSMSAHLSQSVDLSGYLGATLSFWYKMPSIESCCDGAEVWMDGIDSVRVWSASDPVADWTEVTIDLAPFLGGSPTLRFQFTSDQTVTAEGIYLDDITVTGISRPPNDDCGEGLPLRNEVPVTLNTLGAEDDGRAPACQAQFGKGVWFTISPALNGTVEIDTCGSDFDTVIQVYEGALCRTLSEVADGCNDDNGPVCATPQASVRFGVTGGTPYQILVGGYRGAGGNLQVTARWVDDSPRITAQPDSLTVAIGAPARFDVVAEGTEPLSYQWFLDGQPIAGATGASLRIERVLPGDLGSYTVEVSNPSGTASSQPAELALLVGDKVDRWAAAAIGAALETEVYTALRSALAAERFEPEEWKAVVGWGLNLEGKDPKPVCQIVRIPCLAPSGSELAGMIGIMLGIGDYEDGDLVSPPPVIGGVALVADLRGGQRQVWRILCDAEGVGRPMELVDDGCLAEWLAAAAAGREAPGYAEIVEDLVQASVDCARALEDGEGRGNATCSRAANAMGWFAYWAMSVCLPADWSPPFGGSAAARGGARRAISAADPMSTTPPVVDGTRSCCGYDPNIEGKLGGLLGGEEGFPAEAADWVVTKVGQLVAAIDDTKEWCDVLPESYAVLEGTVGGLAPGGSWWGNAGGLPTHYSAEDSTFTHSSLDWIIDVSPFAANEAWPGSPNYAVLASQFNNTDANGRRKLECEWEDLHVPNFARTFPGDRVWIRGQFIFDCGHPVGLGNLEGFRSEIHPPHALVTMRREGAPLNTDGLAMPATVARVYISPWGGEANNPDNINTDGRVWSSGAQGEPRFDAVNTPYQFRIPLPRKPNHTDLTALPGAALAVRVEPAPELAGAGLATSYGGGMRVTRQGTTHPYLDQVLASVELSLVPDPTDPDYLLVKVPLTNGPIPSLRPGISPIQFKIAVGWDDAPLALQISASMPVMDNLGEFEVAAGDAPAAIAPDHPLANGRTWVPPDRRTRLRVTGPDAAWQIKPVRLELTRFHVVDDHEGLTSAEFRVVAGANGEWRTLPGLGSVGEDDDYSMNVSLPVNAWTDYTPHLDFMVVGYEEDGMDYSLDQDDTLGRLYTRHDGTALGVSPSPYAAVSSSGGDYWVDYRILDDEGLCATDPADPADDLPEGSTTILAPGSRAFTGQHVGPADTADWFALNATDYLTLSATLTDRTTESADRCRTYDLAVTTERAVLPPDRFDDGLVANTPCGSTAPPWKIEEFAGRNEDWETSPILTLCPPAVNGEDFDCGNAAPMQEFFPDNLWLDTLNFHFPHPGIESTPDVDYFRIRLPQVNEQCDAPCPPILSGKFSPAALSILIESDRDRPVLVTVTNFTTGFVLDNNPATAVPDEVEQNGRRYSITRSGNNTLIQLQCPQGSGAFADGLVGLALSDPEGGRNFYNLRASYQAIASCDIDKLLVSPGMQELILGRLFGAVDPPPDIRFLPMMTVADPANAAATRGQSLPFMDEPADNGNWSDQDRWLVLLPRGQTSMEIAVEAPLGADAFEVGIELRNLDDQPVAQAVEVGNALGNPPGVAVALLAETGGPLDASTSRRYRLQTQQLEGCFYVLKVTRPQPGGRFSFHATFTKTPEITMAPGALAFGNRCQGTPSAPQWIELRNSGADVLTVANLGVAGPEGPDFRLAATPALPTDIPPSGTLRFALYFQPGANGPRTAELVIASNDPDDPELRVPLTGTGQAGDLAPPRLDCPSDRIVYTCSNSATVNYTVTALDDCDTELEVVCLPPSGSEFSRGATEVRCEVTDNAGRTAACAFTVTVLADTEPPVISCPERRVLEAMGPAGALAFFNVNAVDNSGGPVTVTCSPPSGSWFPPGETTVTCEAVDACGNRARCAFAIVVNEFADPHYFADTFDGVDWHEAWASPGAAFTLVNGEVRPNGPRAYIRTAATDYNTLDFQADLVYLIDGGGGAGGLFFGLGAAELDPGYFNEPLHSVYALDHTQDFPLYQGTMVRALAASGSPQNFQAWLDPATTADGQHALRLIKQGDELTWQMDHLFDPATGFEPAYTGTMTLADVPFLDASNSHLFFGSDASPTRIREFRVTRLAPALRAELTGANVILSWPTSAGTGWQLESTAELQPGAAWTAHLPPYAGDGVRNRVEVPAQEASHYYRLRRSGPQP